MAFATSIDSDRGLFYHARISGLPYFFTAQPIPSGWGTTTVTLSAEDYTVSQTLLVEEQLSVARKLHPKAGESQGEGVTLVFSVDRSGSPWLDLLSIGLGRTGSPLSLIVADLAVNGSSATVDGTTGWSNGDTLYKGLETCTISGVPGATSIPITRARYGSWALPTVANAVGVVETGGYGAWVSDHPTGHRGRIVTLWAASGSWEGGVFVPTGSPEDSDSVVVFRGMVRSIELSDDTTRALVYCEPLETLLGRTAGRRLPRARLGPRVEGLVAVNDCTRNVLCEVSQGFSQVYIDTSLDTTGYGDGVATVGSLVAMISNTINAQLQSASWWTGSHNFFVTVFGTDSDGVITLRVAFRNGTGGAAIFSFRLNPDHGTPWRELGFEEIKTSTTGSVSTNSWGYIDIEADRPAPVARLCSAHKVTTVWYHEEVGPDFDITPGPVDKDGSAIAAYLKVGHQIRKVTSATSDSAGGGLNAGFTVDANTYLGSELGEDIYVETGHDQPVAVTQVMAYPGALLPMGWLYLMLSGSGVDGNNHATYDKGWIGGGCHIPAALVDVDAFESFGYLQRLSGERLCVHEPTTLRDVMAGDLIIAAHAVTAEDQLTVIDVSPPGLGDIDDIALALDSTNSVTIGRAAASVSLDENRIVNQVVIRYDLDNGTGEYNTQVYGTYTESVGTYGPIEPLTCESRSLGGPAGDHVVAQAQDAIWAAFGVPYPIVRIATTDLSAWTLQIGSIVSITSDLIPDFSDGLSTITPARGVTAIAGKVWGYEKLWPSGRIQEGADESSDRKVTAILTVVLPPMQAAAFCPWGPACELASYDGVTEAFTSTAHKYSPSTDVLTDLDRFPVDTIVTLMTRDGSTSETLRVATNDGSKVQFGDTPTVTTTPVTMVQAPYSTADVTAAQLRKAHLSDADHKLDKNGGGSDMARRYR